MALGIETLSASFCIVEDGRYFFAFSGSMLGTELRGIRSFPVGYAHQLTMRPMDFEEFSWAVGVEARFFDEVRTCLRERRPVDDALHDVMLRNYRAYMVAGGMPEVVQNYIDSKFSLVETRSIQEQLVRQYAQDIGKYAGRRAFEVRSIFDRIPVQLEGESHRSACRSSTTGRTAVSMTRTSSGLSMRAWAPWCRRSPRRGVPCGARR